MPAEAAEAVASFRNFSDGCRPSEPGEFPASPRVMPAEAAEAVASFRNFSEPRGEPAEPSPTPAATIHETGATSGPGPGGKGKGSGPSSRPSPSIAWKPGGWGLVPETPARGRPAGVSRPSPRPPGVPSPNPAATDTEEESGPGVKSGGEDGSGGESGAGSGPSSRSSSSFASRSLARSLIDRCRSRLAAVAYLRYSEIDRDSSNSARSEAPARSSAARDLSTFLVSRASLARSERTNALSRFTLTGPEEPAALEPRPATARTQSHQIAFGSPNPRAPASTAASSAPERAGSSNHDPPPGGAPNSPGRLVIRPSAGGPSSSDRRPSRRVATNR